MEPEPDVLEEPPTSSGERSAVNRLAVVAGAVVALLVAASALLPSSEENPAWPTDCLVDGRTDMCAEPSAAMTEQTMLTVVREYCEKLSTTPLSSVVPQPFSRLDLASDEVYATTSGSEEEGTEDALLGTSKHVAWVTRSVGGERDGAVDLRCLGSKPRSTSVRLREDQFESTVAAMTQPDTGRINFADVAKRSVDSLVNWRGTDVAFGYTTCNTTGMDLRDLPRGRVFSCITEIYGAVGQSALITSYRVVNSPPYVRPTNIGG